MKREQLIIELDRWIAAVRPRVVIGDDDSIHLSDWQEGYVSALKEVRGKLLGAE